MQAALTCAGTSDDPDSATDMDELAEELAATEDMLHVGGGLDGEHEATLVAHLLQERWLNPFVALRAAGDAGIQAATQASCAHSLAAADDAALAEDIYSALGLAVGSVANKVGD